MPAVLSPDEREALETQFEALSANGPLIVLTRRRFADLAALECDDGAVVSLYVDLTPQSRHNDAWTIDLKSQARRVLGELDARAEKDTILHEIDRMRRWLEDHAPRMGRGAVIFSCPARDLWWSLSLPIALPTRLRVGRRPYLRPLARVRDEHDRYAVVVLDKQRARLFVAQLGHVTEVADILEDTPRHHKQGGRSQMRLQRHHDAHVMWHAGAVAHATLLLMDRFEARHLFVSGTKEVLAEYRVHLPPTIVRQWKGDFTVPIEASAVDVGRAIESLERRAESDMEAAAIARVNDGVPAGRGVWGLGKTVQAVDEKRVQMLVVHDRYRAPGRECVPCRALHLETVSACPKCGKALEEVEDLVDAVLERAVSQEAELELVRSNETRRLLPPGEPIGALLRF
jgi:hypothetical protein